MSRQDSSKTVVGTASSGKTLSQSLHRALNPVPKLGPPINPALLKREKERAEARQNRVADKITAFSGSMLFVYTSSGSAAGSASAWRTIRSAC